MDAMVTVDAEDALDVVAAVAVVDMEFIKNLQRNHNKMHSMRDNLNSNRLSNNKTIFPRKCVHHFPTQPSSLRIRITVGPTDMVSVTNTIAAVVATLPRIMFGRRRA